MPSLRSMNPMHHSGSPKLHRSSPGRKKVALTLAGLAPSRRRLASGYRRTSSSSSTNTTDKGVVGRGLSSRAEKLLDDDDDGDESYRSGGAAAAPTPATAAAALSAPARARGVIENSVRRASKFGGGIYGDAKRSSENNVSRGCPDDESTPKAQPKEMHAFAAENTIESLSKPRQTKADSNPEEKRCGMNDNDDGSGPGAEALLFIYGPDPDLRRDVFQLSCTSTSEELDKLDKSYREQMEQLDLAIESPLQCQKDVASMCGMTAKHSAFLHPKDFCEIKRDALRHAYSVLKKEEQRQQQQQKDLQRQKQQQQQQKELRQEQQRQQQQRQKQLRQQQQQEQQREEQQRKLKLRQEQQQQQQQQKELRQEQQQQRQKQLRQQQQQEQQREEQQRKLRLEQQLRQQQQQKQQLQKHPQEPDSELSNALQLESGGKFFKGFDLDRVVTLRTMVETDPSEISCEKQVASRGFWSEEKCLADLDSDDDADDGDQEVECSYKCKETDEEDGKGGSDPMEGAKNRSFCRKEDEGCVSNARLREEQDSASHYEGHDNLSHYEGHDNASHYEGHDNASHYEGHDDGCNYEGHDGNQDDCGHEEQEEGDHDCATIHTDTHEGGKNYQKQVSPTDPAEFDALIRDSAPHGAYFDRIPHWSRGPSAANASKRKEVFDPFDLHYTSFPRSKIWDDDKDETPQPMDSVSFVCALPKRDEEVVEDNDEPSIRDATDGGGDTIFEMPPDENARALADEPSDKSLSKSHQRNVSADSLTTSQSLSESRQSPNETRVSGKPRWRRRPKLSRVLHSLTSTSGSSVSNASAAAAAATAEEQVESGDEVCVDSGSVVSHLTDEIGVDRFDGGEEVDPLDGIEGGSSVASHPTAVTGGAKEVNPLDEIEGSNGLDCFGSEEDLLGPDEDDDCVANEGKDDEMDCPNAEGPARKRVAEPDGHNMSQEDGDGDEAAVNAMPAKDGVEVEIETLRSVAPETYALDSDDVDSSHQSDDDGDIVEDSDGNSCDVDSDDVASDVVQLSVASSLSSSGSSDDALSECSVDTIEMEAMQSGHPDYHSDDHEQEGGEEADRIRVKENPAHATAKLDAGGDDETESCSTTSSSSHDDPNCCDRINCCEDCCAFACIDACIDSVDYCCRIMCCQGPEEY